MSEETNPTAYNRPNRPILEDADMNGLGQAIITLTKEIWVLTDRLHVMEAVMKENGVDIVDQLRTYQPDEALQTKLKAENEALIDRVLSAIAGT